MTDLRLRVADELGRLTGPGGEASTDSPRSTRRLYLLDPDRVLYRRDVLDEYLAGVPAPSTDGTVVITAGPPGAGKSHALGRLGFEGFRELDADLVKDRLLTRALEDGIYADLLDRSLADGRPVAPRELATLVHNESTAITDGLIRTCADRQENIVVQGTLSWSGLVDRYCRLFAGYSTMIIVDLQVPEPVCQTRAADRWWTRRLGGDPLGGRFTPDAVIARLFDDAGRSRCSTTAHDLYCAASAGSGIPSVRLSIFDEHGDQIEQRTR